MLRESTCVKILKIHGEKAIVSASKLEIINRRLEIQRDEDFIYIPLTHQPEAKELYALKGQIQECEVLSYVFPERKKRITTFVELLEDEFPPHLIPKLPHTVDFIGEIAIIEIPHELDAYQNVIGEAILEAHKNVRTVLAKVGAVVGTHRLREFRLIAGEPSMETIHKEYGCQYYVDLSKVYFSPRLSYEHNRVASSVQDGETVVDMFTGVGPFAILIAKTHDNVNVYAVDVNPHAVELLRRNIKLNRVTGKVHPFAKDAKKIAEERLSRVADRVIMNLPEKAIGFVDAACEIIKSRGGIMHFYGFVSSSNTLENLELHLTETIEESGRKVKKILFSRFVRAVAPYKWQAVLDVRIH